MNRGNIIYNMRKPKGEDTVVLVQGDTLFALVQGDTELALEQPESN